jgi:opacity protein-like surface antigen
MKVYGVGHVIGLLMIACAVCPVVLASSDQSSAEQWQTTLTPYLWAAEISGDMTLRGRTGPVDVSFSDIWDNLDIAVMGRVEAWRGKWGLFVDGLYMDIETDFSTPQGLVAADTTIKMGVLEFGAGYRLWESAVGANDSQELSFDLLGGGRYMYLEGEVDIVPDGPLGALAGNTFSRSEDWVDPFIGGRFTLDLSEKWAAGVRFDFGGFDIGEGSKLTWNLVAGLDYKLSESMSLKGGYRVFDIDWDTGSGTQQFGMDAQFRGPILGLSILF